MEMKHELIMRDGVKYMTNKQVQDKLQIGRHCLRNWELEGKLVPTRVGRRLLYREDDINQLLNGKK